MKKETVLPNSRLPHSSIEKMLIALMSVELSEKHQSFRSPKVSAERRADRRAIASAIRGELIRSFVVAPCVIREPVESVKIQASSALFD
ncbi:hypothetical protein F2Q68_00017943 [Brassica cretica]|uniref:Uncharacterized protein n=1 Tax=Brassica cretica TaxID=69181 RepID=A0A8S9HH57_BRACR|nr:hypothetical protein F2Q68_00017943 [Brassica cretica]